MSLFCLYLGCMRGLNWTVMLIFPSFGSNSSVTSFEALQNIDPLWSAKLTGNLDNIIFSMQLFKDNKNTDCILESFNIINHFFTTKYPSKNTMWV